MFLMAFYDFFNKQYIMNCLMSLMLSVDSSCVMEMDVWSAT